jgi:ATP/maltotriose-dependent transcriptional regulator MalT
VAQTLEDKLARELFLVLDDVDEAGISQAAGQLIALLCRQAPPKLHLVVSSRAEPPFPIERLRGQGAVLELAGADLAFTEEEVAELVARVTSEADPGTAARLYTLTAGWPAAVRLAVEALRATVPAEREAVLDRARQPGGSVYRYLAAEVLAAEPDEVRRLISVVARAWLRPGSARSSASRGRVRYYGPWPGAASSSRGVASAWDGSPSAHL